MAEPLHSYCVAVVGAEDLMGSDTLARLIELLVNRYQGTHRICLVSAGPRSPELRWCQDRGWTLILEPANRNNVKQECGLVATADALVVLGDPAPWQRLLNLCRQARIPTRVYQTRPRLPPPTNPYPAEG